MIPFNAVVMNRRLVLRDHVTSTGTLKDKRGKFKCVNMAADQEECPPGGALYVEKKERLVAYLY